MNAPVNFNNPDNDSWLRADVAQAQRELVERELLEPEKVEPYRMFKMAMEYVLLKSPAVYAQPGKADCWHLLDVGCGVGHYGVLCGRYFPNVIYFGSDYAISMIRLAKQVFPDGIYFWDSFEQNKFETFEIVHISQCIELTADPWAALGLVIGRAARFVILNKLRLADKSGFIDEDTYGGHKGKIWLWNKHELLEFLSKEWAWKTVFDWEGRQAITVVGSRSYG